MPVLSILLLLALTDAAADLFWRKHIYYNQDMNWTEAQTYCRNNYVDLSIIDTQSEFNSFVIQIGSKKSDSCWIGLRKEINGDIQWTDGTILGFEKWKGGEPVNPPNKDCVFTNNNKWEHDDCNKQYKVFCYTWEPQMIVVQEMMNWKEALVYCRTHYTDLVGFTDKIDYFVVNNRKNELHLLSLHLVSRVFLCHGKFIEYEVAQWLRYWTIEWKVASQIPTQPSCRCWDPEQGHKPTLTQLQYCNVTEYKYFVTVLKKKFHVSVLYFAI
ncbi:C-type mannose receptor 2-like [Tachysurus ichikawai]